MNLEKTAEYNSSIAQQKNSLNGPMPPESCVKKTGLHYFVAKVFGLNLQFTLADLINFSVV